MVEFKRVVVPDEIEALCDFDRKAFGLYPHDVFSPQWWEKCESYWMISDGKVVGCTAFLLNADYDAQPRPGCLCIDSTGVLPEFQGRGFGRQEGNRKNGKLDTRGMGASLKSLPSCGKAILESFD
jgi:GNAT superfamily N-acetyltransferase